MSFGVHAVLELGRQVGQTKKRRWIFHMHLATGILSKMILELRKREKFQLERNSSEKQGKHRQVLLRFALGCACVRACVFVLPDSRLRQPLFVIFVS